MKNSKNIHIPLNGVLYPGFRGFLVNKADKEGPRFEMYGRIKNQCDCVSRQIPKMVLCEGTILKLTGFATNTETGKFDYIASSGIIVPFDDIQMVLATSEKDAKEYFENQK